jgi:hypothetical protein
MRGRVTRIAQRDQVLFRVIPGVTAKFFVMDFKIGHAAAGLASPAIPAEHMPAELFVFLRIEPQTGTFRPHPVHEAFPAKWSRNAFLSSPGKNLKNRRADCKSTSGLPA